MPKEKFVGEYPINASKKMLYPYFSTASGLAQWFADDVNIDEDKVFTFLWDGEENKAKLVSTRTNSHVKFEFIDDDDDDPAYVEFKLDMNELTQEVFIRVTDYNDNMDSEETNDLYESLIHDLKEIVGG
ncbi:MAG: START-like domain-containing protein [Cyclobacteriaceae bacterium]